MSSEVTLHQVHLKDAAPASVRLRGQQLRVLRGTLPTKYFEAIEVPPYQRLLMTTAKHDELIEALGPKGIGVPDDLLLCTRSTKFRALGNGELLVPTNALYTLDGLQRYGAAMARLERGQETDDFGVKILMGTTHELEVDLFYQVNRLQTKVSTHVLLRNAGTNAALEALRQMADETRGFPMVQWNQQRIAGEQITAHTLYEVAIVLHGYAQGRDIEGIIEALDDLANEMGTGQLTENVKTFFAVVDRIVSGTDLIRYVHRVGLLRGLALLFAKYEDFWRGPKLVVNRELIAKMHGIRLGEIQDALRQNNAAEAVCRRMEIHVEKGRRSKPLRLRQY